eukprot:scaffold108759_cov30-Phaeocystis_antarctica.AAC.1
MRARVAVISDAGFRNTFGCADADRAVSHRRLQPRTSRRGPRQEHMGAPRAATMVPRAALLPVEVGAKQRTMLQAAAHGSKGAPPQNTAAGAAADGAPPPRDAVEGSIAMVYLFV